jgi:hypothetical protein
MAVTLTVILFPVMISSDHYDDSSNLLRIAAVTTCMWLLRNPTFAVIVNVQCHCRTNDNDTVVKNKI